MKEWATYEFSWVLLLRTGGYATSLVVGYADSDILRLATARLHRKEAIIQSLAALASAHSQEDGSHPLG